MMKLRLGLLGTAAAIAVAAACSSSSNSPGGTGTEAGTDSGSPDDSGGGTPPSDGAVATAPPIMCGSMTCNAPAGLLPLSPCCLPSGGCGGSFGAAALSMFDAGGFDASGFAGFDAGAICLDTSAGTPDTSCPSQSAMGFNLAGCCTASGVCGLDLSLAGLGCNSLSALASMAPAGALGDSGLGGPPQACGATGDSGASDSGASEAGVAPEGGDAGDGGVP